MASVVFPDASTFLNLADDVAASLPGDIYSLSVLGSLFTSGYALAVSKEWVKFINSAHFDEGASLFSVVGEDGFFKVLKKFKNRAEVEAWIVRVATPGSFLLLVGRPVKGYYRSAALDFDKAQFW